MPKNVDHEQRKKRIAKAMWRVILDKGMEGATVRNIAEEAGLSLGALRYYFQTQDDLLIYAMTLVQEKAMTRINAVIQKPLPPKEMAMAVLLEIVPINKEQLAEMEVWFAFVAHTHHRKDILQIPDDGIFDGIRNIIAFLHEQGVLKDGLDLDVETERLYALIDGISMHAMVDKNRLPSERIIKTIQYHMNAICIDN